ETRILAPAGRERKVRPPPRNRRLSFWPLILMRAGIKPESTGIRMRLDKHRVDVLRRRRVRRFRREAKIHGIDRAFQLRSEEAVLYVLHFWVRILFAPNALSTRDLARRDFGQV